jgi:hypothetical protein
MSTTEELLATELRRLRDRVATLEGLESAPTNIICRVYNSAAISHTTSGTFQALTFDSERFDPSGMHSTSSNTSRITVPRAGKYLIGATIRFALSATGARQVRLRVNGATTIAQCNTAAYSGLEMVLNISTVYQLAANDYVEVLAWQDTGGALNLQASAEESPEFWASLLP